MSKIEFSTTINEDDYAAWSFMLNTSSSARSPQNKALMTVLLFVFFLMLSLSDIWRESYGLTCFLKTLRSMPIDQIAPLLFPPLAGAGAYIYLSSGKFLKAMVYRQMRKILSVAGGKSGPATQQIEIDDDEGVTAKAFGTTLRFPWGAASGFFETAEHFFITARFAMAIIIPKRELTSDQTSAIRVQLGAKLDARPSPMD